MANKIKLGKRPETFREIEVTIALPDGTEGVIPVTFKYMTQDEYTEYREKFFALVTESEAKDGWKLSDYAKANRRKLTEHVFGSLHAWGLDADLSSDSLDQLFNEVPGASIAMIEAFQSACMQGRLGN